MKRFLLSIIVIFLTSSAIFAYEVYDVSENLKSFFHGTGVWINSKTGEKEVETYKDYKERNEKVPYDKYYCLALPNKTYGYLIRQNRLRSAGYVYQTDNYAYYEKQKCIPNVDSYPVIHDIAEIKYTKNRDDRISRQTRRKNEP